MPTEPPDARDPEHLRRLLAASDAALARIEAAHHVVELEGAGVAAYDAAVQEAADNDAATSAAERERAARRTEFAMLEAVLARALPVLPAVLGPGRVGRRRFRPDVRLFDLATPLRDAEYRMKGQVYGDVTFCRWRGVAVTEDGRIVRYTLRWRVHEAESMARVQLEPYDPDTDAESPGPLLRALLQRIAAVTKTLEARAADVRRAAAERRLL